MMRSAATWAMDPGLGDPGFGDVDPGIPGPFVGFFVLVLVLGVAGTVWRVSTARRMAREAGMDPDRAASMALFSDDGLEATYLASSIRGPEGAKATAGSPDAADRLQELQRLRDADLISAEEYQERRRVILDSI